VTSADPRTWPVPPACACNECVGACSYKPGWFAPGEVAKTAALLQITPRELFRTKLALDYDYVRRDGEHRAVFALSPVTTTLRPGAIWPFGSPCGRCVFLQPDSRCGIHAAKPLECKLAHHELTDDESLSEHAAIVRLWDTPEGRAEIREVSGDDPVAPTPTLTDIIKLHVLGVER
jgi:Fe-S-cluster containining protein